MTAGAQGLQTQGQLVDTNQSTPQKYVVSVGNKVRCSRSGAGKAASPGNRTPAVGTLALCWAPHFVYVYLCVRCPLTQMHWPAVPGSSRLLFSAGEGESPAPEVTLWPHGEGRAGRPPGHQQPRPFPFLISVGGRQGPAGGGFWHVAARRALLLPQVRAEGLPAPRSPCSCHPPARQPRPRPCGSCPRLRAGVGTRRAAASPGRRGLCSAFPSASSARYGVFVITPHELLLKGDAEKIVRPTHTKLPRSQGRRLSALLFSLPAARRPPEPQQQGPLSLCRPRAPDGG